MIITHAVVGLVKRGRGIEVQFESMKGRMRWLESVPWNASTRQWLWDPASMDNILAGLSEADSARILAAQIEVSR